MNTFNRRKSSRRSKKAKPFGKLTIDTKFASQGRTFPYESRLQELSFVSFEESKARKDAFTRKGNLKRLLGTGLPVHAGAQREARVANELPTEPARSATGDIISWEPKSAYAENSLPLPTVQKRGKGLRPSPLDLRQDVSPSDRAITIGISLPSSTVSNHSRTPDTPTHLSNTPPVGQTPIIVITPAKDHFSPSDLSYGAGHRPASSVYSRYTNGLFRSRSDSNAPPVPPLPFFADPPPLKSKWSMSTAPFRESALTAFEEGLPTSRTRDTRFSSSTIFEGVESDQPLTAQSGHLATALPTPRRSKGWWNVITSPFSAKSTTTHFWKSTANGSGPDGAPILDDVAAMGAADPHAGLIFTNRALDDEELRSAPPTGLGEDPFENGVPRPPRRSDTAPGALDAHATDEVNIYRIPSTGLAATYYDLNRNFPSLYVQSRGMDEDLAGWSPSQSVFIPSRERDSRYESHHVAVVDDDDAEDLANEAASRAIEAEEAGLEGDDTSKAKSSSVVVEPKPREVSLGNTVFSSPSEDELKSAGLAQTPTSPAKGATIDSVMSPMSATPVVEDAQIARSAGPHSSIGEQRQIDVSPAPTPSHYGLGFATLGAATISHDPKNYTAEPEQEKEVVEAEQPPRPAHVRQDSHGLGISDGERELFPPSPPTPPPPPMMSEKPRLGTDRFGQLTVRSVNDNGSSRPWYRRFFWLLAAVAAALLVLLIVLLVVFVPQKHADVAVQASWMNLTGFPALAVGVSTVIQPNNTHSRNSCVKPSNMWSCAAPSTEGNANLPNFRFEIRFRNGTVPKNETIPTTSIRKRWQESSPLHTFVKRSPWSSILFSASPSPPSQEDQKFLGLTTDNVSTPYNGEETPFYISLLNPEQLTVTDKNQKRSTSGESNFTYPYPSTYNSDGTTAASTKAPQDIPSPSLSSDGKPSPEELYPYVSAQPLHLFNRGQASEHYGFYTYFDRSIHIPNIVPANISSNSNNGTNTSAAAAAATAAACTFSQTRLHIQIWTRKNITLSTLSPSKSSSNNNNNNDGDGDDDDDNVTAAAASNSTANDFTGSGSFPYPVTITLDRHGGNAQKKGVYCYGIDGEGDVMGKEKWWVAEDRGVEGTIVNAADVPGGNGTSGGGGSGAEERRDDESGSLKGGVDGGSGGCDCQWANWEL